MNICFYISDYGYGHASRDIAIIRELIKNYRHLRIYVKTGRPYNFVKRSLQSKNVEVILQKNDVGILTEKEFLRVNKQKTKELVERWVNSWDIYVEQEKKFCKRNHIDLIISDIPPQPFLVGDEVGIPTIAITNFTWYDIYYHLFGETDETRKIKELYKLTSIALILPFNNKLAKVFPHRKSIGLVTRKITVSKDKIRKKYALQENDTVIYLGMGMSVSQDTIKHFIKKLGEIFDRNIKFLISANSSLCMNKNLIKIPKNETETQNYINICDLVISKAGYSTVAEAINSKIPMLLFVREGFIEDKIITHEIEKHGIGKTISINSLFSGKWINELEKLGMYKEGYNKLSDIFRRNGIDEILKVIDEVIK